MHIGEITWVSRNGCVDSLATQKSKKSFNVTKKVIVTIWQNGGHEMVVLHHYGQSAMEEEEITMMASFQSKVEGIKDHYNSGGEID